MAFLKQKELVGKAFSIEFKDSKKHIAIWDDEEKKVIKLGESLTLKDGSSVVFEEYIKLGEQDKNRYRHMISFIRKIDVGTGEDSYCGFTKTVEDQIVQLVDSFTNLDLDFSTLAFVLTAQENNRQQPYKVGAKKKGSDEKPAEKVECVDVSVPKVGDSTEVTEKEQKIIDTYVETIKAQGYDAKSDEVRASFISGFVDNGVAEERAKKLYDAHIVK